MEALPLQQDVNTMDILQMFCNLRTSLLSMPRDVDHKAEEPSPRVAQPIQKKEIEMIESILKKNEEEKQIIQNHFQQRLQEVNSERDSLVKNTLELKIRIEEQAKIVDELKIKNVELEENQKSTQQERNSLQAKFQSLESTSSKFIRKYQLLEVELLKICQYAATFETTVQRLESNQNQLLKANEKFQIELKKSHQMEEVIRSQSQSAFKELSELKGKIASMEMELQTKCLDIQKLQTIISEKDQKLLQFEQENSALQKQIIQDEMNNREMDIKLMSLNNKVVSTDRRISDANFKHHEELRILVHEKLELEKQITSVKLDSAMKIEELTRNVEKQKRDHEGALLRNKKLEEQLHQIQSNLNETNISSSSTQEMQVLFEQKMKEFESEVQILKNENASLSESKDDDKKELEVLQLQHSKDEILIKKLEQDVFRLQISLDEAKRECKNKPMDSSSIEKANSIPFKKQEVVQEKKPEPFQQPTIPSAPTSINQVVKCKSCSKLCFGLVVKCTKCSESFHALCTQTSQLKNFVCTSCKKSK